MQSSSSAEILSKKYRLGGPQVDRDMKWIMNDDELLKPQQREDLNIDRQSEKKVFESELGRVNRENTSLKDQLQRALTELRSYQIKYPPAHGKVDTISTDNLPPWTTSEEIMNPLFEAYDTRIAELEKIIETQSVQLEAFHEKVQAVTEENENLRHAQLENLRIKENRNPTFGSLSDDLFAELNERIEILMSENALMVDQKTLLGNELEAHQEELTLRTKEVTKLTQLLNNNLKDLKACKEHIAQAEGERDEAAEKALSYSDVVARAEVQVDDMKEKLALSQTKAANLERDLKEANTTIKGLVSKSDNDAHVSMKRMKAAEDRIMELHSQLLQNTEELDTAQEVIRKLKREYQSTRQDAEGMLQVMQGLERQVAAYSEREKEVERMASENKNKLEDVLIARDQAISREKQSLLEVERLLAERKAYAQERHTTMERVAEEARQRALSQVQSLQESLEKMAIQNTDLRAECEKCTRESKSAKDLLEKMQKDIEDERRTVQSVIEKLSKDLSAAMKNIENESARRSRIQNENIEHRLTIDKLRAQIENARTNQEQREKLHDSEISALRATAREANKSAVDKSRALTAKTKEFNDLKTDMEDRFSTSEQRKDMEIGILKQRSSELEKLARELEQATVVEEKRNAALIEKLKETFSITSNALERQLYDTNEGFKRLEAANKDLDASLQEFKSEKSALSRSLEEAKATIFHLQDDLEDAHGTVAALSAQLAASFEARDAASLRSVNALLGPRLQKRAASLRSRATELAEEIAEESFDNNRYDYEDTPAHQFAAMHVDVE